MRTTFRLGRIAGIRIGVHWSVLVVFAIIAGGLAAGFFPDAYPGDPRASHVVAGLATALVFFASLLGHEISHALVARREGVEVEDITLWLFGGLARLSGEARSPGAELRIAGVGPLVSLVLGVLFLLSALLLPAAGVGGLVPAALVWLGGINIALAVFNVIPAAPLDGGRLLRAAIWKRTGDRLTATLWASRAGRVFGALLVGAGLFMFFTTAAFGGLWFALIGWFLIAAATAEGEQATVRDLLGHMPVRDLMTPDPVALPGATTVEQLLGGDLLRRRHSTFPLTAGDGTAIGLVTFGQVRGVAPERRATTTLADIGCGMDEVTQVRPDESAAELLGRLSECAQGRALVVDGGSVVGIVTPSDVSRALRWAGIPAQRRA